MDIVFIQGRAALRGNKSFTMETFFGLVPGDSVSQIGDGRNSGTYRTDFFKEPMIYRGACKDADDVWFAFELPEELKMGIEEPLYFLYGTTGMEIFTPIKDGTRFYSPVFESKMRNNG